mmetsp:Transcript_38319/g.81411  ORF Transcript_38319/g.81411 Transcript_38319/m.81411 type:complete len:221 (-) Transcript_38319:2855-3517(-)
MRPSSAKASSSSGRPSTIRVCSPGSNVKVGDSAEGLTKKTGEVNFLACSPMSRLKSFTASVSLVSGRVAEFTSRRELSGALPRSQSVIDWESSNHTIASIASTFTVAMKETVVATGQKNLKGAPASRRRPCRHLKSQEPAGMTPRRARESHTKEPGAASGRVWFTSSTSRLSFERRRGAEPSTLVGTSFNTSPVSGPEYLSSHTPGVPGRPASSLGPRLK